MPMRPLELRRCVARASRQPDYRSQWARHAAQQQTRWRQLSLYTLKRHLKYPLVLCHTVPPFDVPGVMKKRKTEAKCEPIKELTTYWPSIKAPTPPPTLEPPIVTSKYFGPEPKKPKKRVPPSKAVLRERNRVRLLHKWIDSYAFKID